MNKLHAVFASASMVAAAPSLAATTFQFDTDPAKSFVKVTSNSTGCVLLGTCPLTASLATPFDSFTLNPGQARSFNFARVKVGSGIGLGTATLDAQLGFVLPQAAPAGSTGSANYLRVGGLFTPGVLAGSLTWTTPQQQVVGFNGARFNVTFGNLTGAQFGASVFVPVTIGLISDAVPEPATWALMLIGFGTAGSALRSARRQAGAIVAA